MVLLTTCGIVIGVTMPFIGGFTMFIRKCLKTQSKLTTTDTCEFDTYVELPNRYNNIHDRMSFLNKTLYDAASCNCPILCQLLIERGATELEPALEVAASNGHIAICKLLIDNGAHNLEQALKIAQQHKKHNITIYINDLLES